MATNNDPAAAREDVRRKKEAYKQAKRDAGMSNGPKIAAAIIGAVAILATGSYGGYSFAVASNDNLVALQQQLASSQASDADVTDVADEPTADSGDAVVDANDDEASEAEATAEDEGGAEAAGESVATGSTAQADSMLVGEWKASFVGTTGGTGKCYGGRENPLSLNVESVDSAGVATFDASVLFHGHKVNNDYEDWEQSAKDQVLEVYGLQGNFNSALVFTAAKSQGRSATVKISGDPSTGELSATVESYNNTTDPVEIDEYTLTKQ